MKSEKSVAEIEMLELLKVAEDIVDDSYLTTQDARKILDAGHKLLQKSEKLRKSRDMAITRRDSMRVQLREIAQGHGVKI